MVTQKLAEGKLFMKQLIRERQVRGRDGSDLAGGANINRVIVSRLQNGGPRPGTALGLGRYLGPAKDTSGR